MVDGQAINSCLGDLYSVVWMEDSDAGIARESLDDQLQTTIAGTNQSHVQVYGGARRGERLFGRGPISSARSGVGLTSPRALAVRQRVVAVSNAFGPECTLTSAVVASLDREEHGGRGRPGGSTLTASSFYLRPITLARPRCRPVCARVQACACA